MNRVHWPPGAPANADPRRVFLGAHDVMARCGSAKTKGSSNLKDRSLVPAGHDAPDRWRLDQSLAWEAKRMELAGGALDALTAPEGEELYLTDPLSQPKRRRPVCPSEA